MRAAANRSVHLRFAKLYLTAIGSVALLLLILFAVSLEQKRQAVKSLSATSLRLDGERLAVELERRTWELAEQCLRNTEIQGLAADLAGESDPGAVLELRTRLEEIARRHPLAEHFFVFANGGLRFPQLKTPEPRIPVSAADHASAPVEREFSSILREAAGEARQGRREKAIRLYIQGSELPVSNNLKALALSRLAACYLAEKKPTDAVRIYHRLKDRFGDCYDELHRPYALVAAFEIDRVSAGRPPPAPDSLLHLYQDLINGRWQLSAEVLQHYKNRLEMRLGTGIAAGEETEYLREFRMAHAVEGMLRQAYAPADPQRIRTVAIQDGESDAQIFWIPLAVEDPEGRVLAFSVDLAWVSGPLLNRCAESLKAATGLPPAFRVDLSSPSAASDAIAPFRTVFPFLALHLPKGATEAGRTAALIEIALVGVSVIMMASLLCLIFILLSRVSKELHQLQLRSDFLSGVTHDLKTPLTLIMLYSETLLSNGSLSEEERQKSYQVISREGRRLHHLIKNLLHLSTLQRATQDYRMTEEDLAPVIQSTAAVCAEWLTQHGFTLKTDIAANLPPVRFDPERVSQAFINAIDNARKYSGASRSVDVRLWSEGSIVILEIQDYGIGVPESERQKIFEQFYRASNARGQSGSGLGLFLLSDVMRAHRGSIELDSAIGRGSRFRLLFPASVALSQESESPALELRQEG